MPRRRPHSAQTMALLGALAADPTTWRYGYDLCVELGLKSGSLYPILIRLADRGLLESSWDVAELGKPPRHLYRLTNAGLAEAAGRAEAAPARRAETAPVHRAARPSATRRAHLGPA